MVVSSMTAYEMFEGLLADKDKIEFKRQQLESKAVKKFKKAIKFPAWDISKYEIPGSGNSYILYFYAESRQAAEKPVFDYFAFIFDGNDRLVVKCWCQPYQHKPSEPPIVTPITNVYLGHFFQRYRKRILKDTELPTDEVICRYFTRNSKAPKMIKLNEDIMKNYREYGDMAEYGMKVRDGICLTRTSVQGYLDESSQKEIVDAIGQIYVTFIDENTLKDTQNEAILKENIRYSEELIKNLMPHLKV